MTDETPPSSEPAVCPDILLLDLETTGLDPERCTILEVGVILTDWDLRERASASWVVSHAGPVSAFIGDMHGPPECLWGPERQPGSGLLAECRASTLTLDEVGARLSTWLTVHGVLGKVKPWLAGNSVHFDRGFLRRHLPSIEARVLHRHLDATSLDGALGRWLGYPARQGHVPHRAMADLRSALTRMRHQREVLRLLAEANPRGVYVGQGSGS